MRENCRKVSEISNFKQMWILTCSNDLKDEAVCGDDALLTNLRKISQKCINCTRSQKYIVSGLTI